MPEPTCASCGSDGLDGKPRLAVSESTGETLCSVCEVFIFRVLWGVLDRWNDISRLRDDAKGRGEAHA